MKPNTRKEMFLDAIADGEPCNLVPANRKELLLQRMAENAGGGGGGSDAVVKFEINWVNDEPVHRIDGDFATALAALKAGKPVHAYFDELYEGKPTDTTGMYFKRIRYDDVTGEAIQIEFLDLTENYAGTLNIDPENDYIGENNG